MSNFEELVEILPDIIARYPSNQEFRKLYILSLIEQSRWIEVIEEFSKIEIEYQAELNHLFTLANYRLGQIDEAYSTLRTPNLGDSYEYWELVSEIGLIMEDTELVKYCYKMMIAIFPKIKKYETMQKLLQLRFQRI